MAEKLPEQTKILWIKARNMWSLRRMALPNFLSNLSEKELNSLYEVAKLGLFKTSYVEVVTKHPGLRGLINNEIDRMCMLDMYQILSMKLNRKEEPPKEAKLIMNMVSSLGRGYRLANDKPETQPKPGKIGPKKKK